MKGYFDRDGKSIIEGDIISIRCTDGKVSNTLYGYEISKVKYDEKRDKLVDCSGYGFRMAYGLVRLNDRSN